MMLPLRAEAVRSLRTATGVTVNPTICMMKRQINYQILYECMLVNRRARDDVRILSPFETNVDIDDC